MTNANSLASRSRAGSDRRRCWPRDHEHSWLEVRDLTMTDAQAAARIAEPGGVEPGCDPRDGVFCYSPDTQLLRVDDAHPHG